MEYTACFTGHRPQNLPCGFDETHPACIKIKLQLKRMIVGLIEKKGTTHFIAGAALGSDTWAMEIVIELKKIYPNITLEAAVPCRTQAKRWNYSAKERYDRLLAVCDKVTLVQDEYTADCMMKRNKYMVDNSNYIIAVWNGKPSGTGKTVEYALKHKKAVYCIDPISYKMRTVHFNLT